MCSRSWFPESEGVGRGKTREDTQTKWTHSEVHVHQQNISIIMIVLIILIVLIVLIALIILIILIALIVLIVLCMLRHYGFIDIANAKYYLNIVHKYYFLVIKKNQNRCRRHKLTSDSKVCCSVFPQEEALP